DPDAVVRAMRMACRYRQRFHKDVCVHLLGYRRYGHNEGDEPSFTQPLMYAQIKKHPRVSKLYREKLLAKGLLQKSLLDSIESDIKNYLDQQHQNVESGKIQCIDRNLEPGWDQVWEEDLQKRKTGVPLEVLDKVVDNISNLPDSISFNKKMVKFTKSRRESWEADKVDWAFAEALCFGSLLLEKKRVRLSGQDSRRGTFSQRNLVLYSDQDGSEYIPLNHITEDQQSICVFNSMLSELAVLGFEYGFALGNPDTLVMWEAQFGDFANGAQAMMDVFIASGESKWQTQNGLVMLLPHGYEGQGPEHSSARLERYLQLCASYNLRVCNTTTPANYFHVLRRQVMKKDRRPLVLMTPKVLLRLRGCVSSRQDFAADKVFIKVIVGSDKLQLPKDKVKRLIFCSGKLFYELLDYREKNSIKDVELVRLEQLYPFPYKTIMKIIQSYPDLQSCKWVQEERKNMGAWSYVEPRFRQLIEDSKLIPTYVGRDEGASPSSGFAHVHKEGQAQLIAEAFDNAE
ncbi:MAG: thiamine pyrophosphate-dependent enzyme, partial [bacterium]|nr:thiamine pyrophosphate-dependent enzyme [bacterium]